MAMERWLTAHLATGIEVMPVGKLMGQMNEKIDTCLSVLLVKLKGYELVAKTMLAADLMASTDVVAADIMMAGYVNTFDRVAYLCLTDKDQGSVSLVLCLAYPGDRDKAIATLRGYQWLLPTHRHDEASYA